MKPDAGKPLVIRTIRAFGYAVRGIAAASRDRMFRLQLIAGVLASAVGAWLRLSAIEWAILTLTIAGVLALEVMNTAIEALVDLVSPEPHPLAGRAKDLAAGAVLVASAGAAIVGAILFAPKLLHLVAR